LKSTCLLLALISLATTCSAEWKLETREINGKLAVDLVQNGETRTVFEGIDKWRTPTIEKLEPTLYIVVSSCGSPCSYSKFVRTDTGEIDGPFFLVMHFDKKTWSVFYVGDNGKLTRKGLFSRSQAISYDLPDASLTAVISLVIKNITVLADDSVQVEYLTGKTFAERQIRIR
jgi:hypothetical protein